MKRIAITGMGAVTCVSRNVKELFNALSNPPKSSFRKSSRIDLDIDIIVGEAHDDCFTKPKNEFFDNPTSRLCLSSAKECVEDYPKPNEKHKPDTLIVGTSTGGQKLCEDFIFSLSKRESPKDFNYISQGTMASPTRLIADELSIEGRVLTVSTACTSSANAIAMGCSMIERGVSKAVLAGGGDALCATTLSGFHILGLTGLYPCSPFSPNRKGMTLGDGAGFLMLEPLDIVLKEDRPYYAELLGYGFSSDAFSMTSPCENGEMAVVAIKSALDKANLKPSDVEFINAHGTGTVFNDRAEAKAIASVFNDVPVASIKGLIGHTLGSAGALEAIASVYSVIHKKAWENFNAHTCDKDCPVQLVPKGGITLSDNPVILSNSFAFGGNNCVLLFG